MVFESRLQISREREREREKERERLGIMVWNLAFADGNCPRIRFSTVEYLHHLQVSRFFFLSIRHTWHFSSRHWISSDSSPAFDLIICSFQFAAWPLFFLFLFFLRPNFPSPSFIRLRLFASNLTSSSLVNFSVFHLFLLVSFSNISTSFFLIFFLYFLLFFLTFLFHSFRISSIPVGWACRIQRLYLCRGARPFPQRVPWIWHWTMELWGAWRTPSLTLVPGLSWPGVVAPERFLLMSQMGQTMSAKNVWC